MSWPSPFRPTPPSSIPLTASGATSSTAGFRITRHLTWTCCALRSRRNLTASDRRKSCFGPSSGTPSCHSVCSRNPLDRGRRSGQLHAQPPRRRPHLLQRDAHQLLNALGRQPHLARQLVELHGLADEPVAPLDHPGEARP